MSGRAVQALLILAVGALQSGSAVDAHADGASRAEGPTATAPANDREQGFLESLLADPDGLPVMAVTADGTTTRYRRLRDIPEPAQLRTVHAQFAEVDDRELEALAAAKQLAFLILPGSGGTKPADITDIGLEKIARLSNLTWLSLGTEHATDAGVSQLGRLTELLNLELYAPQATDASMISLGELPRLGMVTLHVPHMTDAGLAQFRNLSDLWSLDVSGTSVTGLAFASVARRNSLLHVSGNFTDEGLRVISKAPSLTGVDIFGKQVTADGLRHLAAVRSLTHVGLHGTRVTRETIRTLQRDNPKLFFERD